MTGEKHDIEAALERIGIACDVLDDEGSITGRKCIIFHASSYTIKAHIADLEARLTKQDAELAALMLEHEAAELLLTRDEFGTIAWDGVSSTYTVAEDALDRLTAAHQAAREAMSDE